MSCGRGRCGDSRAICRPGCELGGLRASIWQRAGRAPGGRKPAGLWQAVGRAANAEIPNGAAADLGRSYSPARPFTFCRTLL